MKHVSKEIKLLAIIFFLVFFSYNGAQQYITTFFSSIGAPQSGFYSLIIVYLFFTLSYPLSSIFISKYGSKKAMATGIIFYTLFIVALATKSVTLIYLSSIALGIAASLLWTGQSSFLIQATEEKSRGSQAGFFSTIFFLGASIGVLLLGFIISRFSYSTSFILVSVFPIIGLILTFKLKDFRTEKSVNHFHLLKKVLTSKTAWQLSVFWFLLQFIYGLAIGFIPIQIKNTLGTSYIGLTSVFYLFPILLSYGSGKLMDLKGRKVMIVLCLLINFIGLGSLYFFQTKLSLVSGIILLAINYSIASPLTSTLVGDVSTKNNLDYLAGFFWMVSNIGAVSALVISSIIQTKMIYLISLGILGIIFLILLPLLRLDFHKIRQKISEEVE